MTDKKISHSQQSTSSSGCFLLNGLDLSLNLSAYMLLARSSLNEPMLQTTP
jgi:hypothetical protein